MIINESENFKGLDHIQKRHLYRMLRDETIPFCERHTDGSCEFVDIVFHVTPEQQVAYYANEYILGEKRTRSVDITAIITDDHDKGATDFLFDVKSRVGAVNDIEKLTEQWISGMHYLDTLYQNNCLSARARNIGVITRDFDKGRVMREKEKMMLEIQNIQKDIERITPALKRKIQIEVENRKRKYAVVDRFYDGKLYYRGQMYTYFVYLLEKEMQTLNYKTKIDVEYANSYDNEN